MRDSCWLVHFLVEGVNLWFYMKVHWSVLFSLFLSHSMLGISLETMSCAMSVLIRLTPDFFLDRDVLVSQFETFIVFYDEQCL